MAGKRRIGRVAKPPNSLRPSRMGDKGLMELFEGDWPDELPYSINQMIGSVKR